MTALTPAPEYPAHRHQFVVAFYENCRIDYIFGPFTEKTEAHAWARDFNRQYARPGERYRYSRLVIYPTCEPLSLPQ